MRASVFLLLVVMAIVIAAIYGAAHDQISYSVSSEYFTQFKYRQFGLEDTEWPNRMKAACIGVLASWWMGAPIGLVVGGFGWIHRTIRLMWVRSLWAFAWVAVSALAIGLGGLCYGWFVASQDPVDYPQWFIPEDLRQPGRYLAVGHMHNASYMGGALGILLGVGAQFWQRRQHDPGPSDQRAP